MISGGDLIVCGWGMVGCARKSSYLRPAEIDSFSNRGFSWNNKHDTFWHVVSKMHLLYFYIFTFNVFYIQVWFKLETPLLFFSNKNHGLQKKTLYIKKSFFWRLCKNHWITWSHMTSYAIWVDEIRGVTGMKWQVFATLLKKRHKHRCFPVNIAKVLRTVFFMEHLRCLLVKLDMWTLLANQRTLKEYIENCLPMKVMHIFHDCFFEKYFDQTVFIKLRYKIWFQSNISL